MLWILLKIQTKLQGNFMLKIIKNIILFIAIFWSTASYAEIAAPFGIELGKSTLKDVKAKYEIITTFSKTDYGYSYLLNPRKIPMKHVTEVMIDTDNQHVVQFIQIRADETEFFPLLNTLSAKYKLIRKDLSGSISKTALFQADNCKISLEDYEDTRIYYMTENYSEYLQRKFEKNRQQEIKERAKNF